MNTSIIKIKVQSFGRFLSNMVMPNIGAFIAWGFITALFIPTGWLPNASLAQLIEPMIKYLLPLLIGYTGGKLISGERGGVAGAVATMGVIVGSNIPMLLGAMIVGPLGGYIINRFDKLIEGKIKSGFEMLVNNFSTGIIGLLLAILSYYAIGPSVQWLSAILASGVGVMVKHNLLPLTSIFIEPAKVLFLNNAINHGIFSPLGIQQSAETGHSIFFLIEANPGPGLGLLLAYIFFGKGNAKSSASGAAIIHFFGGIHEIYFPYILMNPRLILAVILGGMSGVFTLTVFNAGLVSPASPGSIFAVLMMTPKSSLLGVILSVLIATTVTFIISALLLKTTQQNEKSIEQATDSISEMKSTAKNSGVGSNAIQRHDFSAVHKIIVACDAGMGSSAMGAGVLRKKVQNASLTAISVENCAINNLPNDADIVITHQDLTSRAKKYAPNAYHISLTNFLDSQLYTNLVDKLKAQSQSSTGTTAASSIISSQNKPAFQLTEKDIFLGLTAENKEQAIRFVGQQLVNAGYVMPEYIDAMLQREALTPTYLGESIAVPHGTIEAKDNILQTGIVFCQYPQGVQFGEEKEDIAKLVIGIAAKNNEHIHVIASLTSALDGEGIIEKLSKTTNKQEILQLLNLV